MPHEGEKSRLDEATIVKYQNFYKLATDLFGKKDADEFVRWVYLSGRFVKGRIKELTGKRLQAETKVQKAALKSPRDEDYVDRLEKAIQSNCHVASELKVLAQSWKQILTDAPSYKQAGELIQVALGDSYPHQSRTDRLNSGI